MLKRLFLLIFSAFIGISANPEILMASDDFALTGLNNTGITETIPIVEEPEEEPEEVSYASYDYSYDYEPVSWTRNYTVSIYIGSVEEYTETAVNLSYSYLYKFRNMIYGHDTYNLLGSLPSLDYGEVFTITEGGVAQEYQVMSKVVYAHTSDGYLENDRRLMGNVASGMGYDVALMTCYNYGPSSFGTTGYNSSIPGDAPYRYVVYANAL